MNRGETLSALKRHPVAIGVLVATLLTAVYAAQRTRVLEQQWLSNAEWASLDLRFRLRGAESVDERIVIVAIDDRTIVEEPSLYERREGWARLVRAIDKAGAKVVGVDAVFTSPERLLSEGLLTALYAHFEEEGPEGPPDRTRFLLMEVFEEVRGDEKLEAAIADAGNVVLGVHLGRSMGGEIAEGTSMATGTFGQVVPGPKVPPQATRARTSLGRFTDAARALGLVSVDEDLDARVRSIPAGRRAGTEVVAPIALQVLVPYLDLDRSALVYRGTDGVIKVGDRQLAVDGARLHLNFRGPPDRYRTYSAIDVASGKLPSGALKDKIVLVGMTDLMQDRVTTPFGLRAPGVEIHATAIDNILHSDLLRRAPAPVDVALTFLAGLAVALLFLPRLRLRPTHQLLGAFLLAAAFAGGTLAVFAVSDLWLAAAPPAIVQLATLIACLGAAYLGEGLQRRELRRTFAHYLSDAVIEELLADPRGISLRGDRRDLTVLFSDIRSFTTLSERLEPLALASFLNTYFTPMTRAVLDAGGFLDKYIGDAIMAVFGAPVHHPGHASEGCRAAVNMHKALLGLRASMKAQGIDLDIGVGLNTGEMVVGNMGSTDRFDYTVLGDAVNLGSRIEGLTKTYGAFCLVGERTRNEAGPEFRFRPVDLVRVKGKDQPAGLFELLGDATHNIRTFESLEDFMNGVATYRAGRFPEARAHFARFLVENPDDKTTKLFLERLDALGDIAPPDWDGVFTHTSK